VKSRLRSSFFRLVIAIAVLALLSSVLAGCEKDKAASGLNNKVLKIAVDSEGFYDYAYRDYIEAAFPDLEIRLIKMEPDRQVAVLDKEYMEIIEKERPDLILSFTNRYEALVRANMLTDLSSRMTGSGMKEDDYYPGMLDSMKQLGGGTLYGLAPEFQSAVLYYNEDLFQKFGVDLPHDGMTLSDIYRLGTRFRDAGGGKEGIVGFYEQFVDQPYDMISSFGSNEGLRKVDYTNGKLIMDTPLWRSTIQTIIDLYKNGTLSLEGTKREIVDGVVMYTKEATEAGDLFGQGKAAMTTIYYQPERKYPFKVGAVTPPVASSDEGLSSGIYIFKTMSIPTVAENADAAWEVIRFMLSDRVAKTSAALEGGQGFSVNMNYAQYNTDPLVARIFQLRPFVEPTLPQGGWDFQKFYRSFSALVNEQIISAVKDGVSLDTVINKIQKDGQALMDQSKR